jgi:peptide/nickel transport system permease protein
VALEFPEAVPAGLVPRRARTRSRALARHVGWALLTLLVISILCYAGTSLRTPAQQAQVALGRVATPAEEQAFVKSHGLDRSLPARYLSWLGNVLQGKFGDSLTTGRPVEEDVGPRLVRTLILTLATLMFAVPIGVGLGVFSARRSGRPVDVGLNIIAVVLSSFPEFVVGLGLLIILGVELKILPTDSGVGIAFGSGFAVVKSYVLPTLTLVVASVPYILRNTRVAVQEALAAPYTRTGVLQGLPRREIIWSRAMRNAASPILNAIALNVIYLLSGVIVVETVFDFPGLGQSLVTAVASGDAPTVQVEALILGGTFVLISIATDALAAVLNPSIRAAGGQDGH